MLEWLPSFSTWMNGFFIFVVLWWLVLFAVLPFSVKRDDAPILGNSTGAPVKAGLKRKFIITSFISLAITITFLSALHNGLIPLPGS